MMTKQAYNLLLASAIIGHAYDYRSTRFESTPKGKGRNKHPHRNNYKQKRGSR